MSKLQEIRDLRELSQKNHQEVLDGYKKDEEKLIKEFEKKIRKLIKGVKFDIEHSNTGLTLKTKKNSTTLMSYTFDTFSFENIEREVAYEIKYLYDDLYGYPEEGQKMYQINYTPTISNYISRLTGY